MNFRKKIIIPQNWYTVTMNYAVIALIVVLLAGTAFFLTKDSNPVDEQIDTETTKSTNGVEDTSVPRETPTETPADSERTLDLSGQGLTTVPSSAFNQTNLEALDLSNNNFAGALPGEVRLLQNLRTLDLSDNNFTGVPAEVGQLTKLEVLDLSNNPITGLPNEIGNLKNLKVLDLRGTNYASQDLEVIRKGLSSEVQIRVD